MNLAAFTCVKQKTDPKNIITSAQPVLQCETTAVTCYIKHVKWEELNFYQTFILTLSVNLKLGCLTQNFHVLHFQKSLPCSLLSASCRNLTVVP